ncbi:trypsin-like cysteine/serine peptidase domain-containing protein [Xylaria digitata]|nr:trypsin-like cysteine/serine peptidase domain-containing protein [Xylaria digitata]
MVNDRDPGEPRASVAALSDEDKGIYMLGLAVSTKLPLATRMVFERMAGLRYSAERMTATPAIDTERLSRPNSTVSGPEGVLQDVADFLTGCLPRERFLRFVQNTDLRDVATQDWPSPPMAVAWKLGAGFSEAILGKNPRDVVPPEEIMPGSLLRGVMKIISVCGGSTVTESGVLIDDWTVATVGHLLVNGHGHAKEVVICAGHGGGDNTVESRGGIYVTVHYDWYNKRSDPNDLAFIRLSEPFGTVNPIGYMQTPITNDDIDASIYGFPYDTPNDALGYRLCVSKCPVRYSQSSSTGMLEHEGDTEKGTSGGPVLDANGIVIALHKGGGGLVNQAVTIDRNGNDFWAFRLILEYMSQMEDDRVRILGEVKEVGGFAFAW